MFTLDSFWQLKAAALSATPQTMQLSVCSVQELYTVQVLNMNHVRRAAQSLTLK
jgi:hypothetical protein